MEYLDVLRWVILLVTFVLCILRARDENHEDLWQSLLLFSSGAYVGTLFAEELIHGIKFVALYVFMYGMAKLLKIC